MSYRIEQKSRWLLSLENGRKIVLVYYMNGVPFTFDDIDDMGSIEFCLDDANENPPLSMEDIYKGSSYLLCEQAHPCIDKIEVENPESLPVDY